MVPPRYPIIDFGDLTRSLEGTYSRDELYRMFARFREMPDNQARLRFIMDNPVFSSFEITPKKDRKCTKESDRMRREANAAFAGRCFDAALICYNKSVVMADTKPDEFEGRKEEDPSTQLALAYFNRANNLYQMKRYLCAIKDIRRAKQAGFAGKELFKLYALESRCWEKLEYYEKALETFGNACKLEPPHGDDLMIRAQQVAKRFAYLNQKAFKDGGQGFKLTDENEQQMLAEPSRIHHRVLPRYRQPRIPRTNERLPAASAKIDLKFHEDKGRHFVVKEDVDPGEVLIKEPPFAKILMPQHWATHCFHCLHITDVPVPCHNCATIVFCSEACREAASYHEFECEFLGNLREQTVVNLTLLAVRMIFTAGLEGVQKANADMKALDIEETEQLHFTPRQQCQPLDYLNLCTMVTHREKWDLMMFFQLGLLAAYVVLLMEKSGFFHEKSKKERVLAMKEERAKEDLQHKKESILAKMMEESSGMAPPKKAVLQKNFSANNASGPNVKAYFEAMPTKKQELVLLVGSFLMRHMMSLRSNRFAISESLIHCSSLAKGNGSGDASHMPDDPVIRFNSIGRAVGATMALLNHSCCPNSSWEYVDDHFVLRALKPIKAGREVTCSYGFKFQTDPAEDRQKMLKKDFMFDCNCDACVESWPLAKDSVSQKPYFQCPACKATMEFMTTCPQCSRECKDEFINLAVSSPEFQQARQDLDRLDIATTEPVITRHIKACDDILHEANIEYVMAVECLKQVFILQGLVTTKSTN